MNRFLRTACGGLLAAVVAALFTSGPLAQTAARPEIDGIFAAWNTRDSPGCALGVYQNGANRLRTRLRHGESRARRADHAGDRSSTSARCRSSSPRWRRRWRFSRGSSSLDDRIRKYLPELPAYADGDHGAASDSSHERPARLQHAAVDRRPPRRRGVRQPGGAADHGAAEEAQLRARRRVPLFEHRLHAAGADRRARDRDAVRRVRRRRRSSSRSA